METKKIKLGICMAGAVSAGAYTAGVIDYLMETLERWQLIKDKINQKIENGEPLSKEEECVPLHDIEIEVLSGASAGGMTAAITTLSLFDDTYLNKKDNKILQENYDFPTSDFDQSKLFKAWTNMVDDSKTTIEKLLSTKNCKSLLEMESLLDSTVIDEIANQAIPKSFNLRVPKYISKDLNVYMTVSSLEGLPININFSNTTETKNQFSIHNGVFGFSIGDYKKSYYPSFKLDDKIIEDFINITKATGAFPIGFVPRQIKLREIDLMKFVVFQKKEYNVEIDIKEGDYKFTAVDGGLINNEPHGITAQHLDKINPQGSNILLFIDPFPTITNTTEIKDNRLTKKTVLNIIPKLFSAARNHAMAKQDHLIDAVNLKENHYIIYPRKNGIYQIACGFLGGFGGFLKKSFRVHDYQLGRKNCQAFLRYYFVKSDDFFKEANMEYNVPQKTLFGIDMNYWKKVSGQNVEKDLKFPLIPDLLYLNHIEDKNIHKDLARVSTPIFEGLSSNEFENIKSLLKIWLPAIINPTLKAIKQNEIKKWYQRTLFNLAEFFLKGRLLSYLNDKLIGFLQTEFKPQAIGQNELLEYIHQQSNIDLNREYKKVIKVSAIQTEEIKKITSITSMGYETENYAKPGDYVVTNHTNTRENYVVSKEKFDKTYIKNDDGSFSKNETVIAININHNLFDTLISKFNVKPFEKETSEGKKLKFIYLESPWGDSQVLFPNDYLIVGDNETYRVDKTEFEESYKKIK